MFVKEEYMPEIKVKYQQFVLSIKKAGNPAFFIGVRGMHTIQEVKVLGSAVQGKIEA